MKIKLQDIVIDKDTQSRDKIDEALVGQYAEDMQEGHKFPALSVFFDGLNYYLVDGYHRYFALLRIGADEFDVVVHNGTRREAEIFSWGVNSKHGMPRSNATKRMIVLKALEDIEFADKNAREIALVCCLSTTYVQNIMNERKKFQKARSEQHTSELQSH